MSHKNPSASLRTLQVHDTRGLRGLQVRLGAQYRRRSTTNTRGCTNYLVPLSLSFFLPKSVPSKMKKRKGKKAREAIGARREELSSACFSWLHGAYTLPRGTAAVSMTGLEPRVFIFELPGIGFPSLSYGQVDARPSLFRWRERGNGKTKVARASIKRRRRSIP